MKEKRYDYPYNVVKAVREYCIEAFDEYLTCEDIEKMHPENVLAIYLAWEGIIGYIQNILSILQQHKD